MLCTVTHFNNPVGVDWKKENQSSLHTGKVEEGEKLLTIHGQSRETI